MEQGIPEPVLRLRGIERWYGDGVQRVDVLRGVDLDVEAGKAIAIVGPSGSGKSTLLHVAGLLDRPNAGQVLVDGRDVALLGDDEVAAIRNRNCGFVYQFHHLLREFTSLENVMMPALIGTGKDFSREEAAARAEGLLAAVGLGKRAGHYPHQLSGGEQQRVALARALMNRPKLLLADEPTGNLDPHTADEVVEHLFGLVVEEGLSALIVTHNMDLAGRCGDVFAMADGLLVE